MHTLLDDHLDPYSRTPVSQSNRYPIPPNNPVYPTQILSFIPLYYAHYLLSPNHNILFILHSYLDVLSNLFIPSLPRLSHTLSLLSQPNQLFHILTLSHSMSPILPLSLHLLLSFLITFILSLALYPLSLLHIFMSYYFTIHPLLLLLAILFIMSFILLHLSNLLYSLLPKLLSTSLVRICILDLCLHIMYLSHLSSSFHLYTLSILMSINL